MKNVREKIVIDYAKNMSVIIVDDDEISLEVYKEVFENLFGRVDTATDGVKAYSLWSQNKEKYDLVITDLMMPNMDGFELISKIRLKSPGQHIVVLSAIIDINEMRDIIELGIDGILVKPYNQEKMFTILGRALKLVYNEKLLKRQAMQLRLLAKENIDAKVSLHENNIDIKGKPLMKKVAKKRDLHEDSVKNKDNKYHTRAHLHGDSAEDFTSNLDYLDMDRVEVFQDKIEQYQNAACGLINAEPQEAKEDLKSICNGLSELIDVLNHLGAFSVTAEATKKLIEFIDNLKIEELDDYDKKDLFVDGLMAILEDLNNWIEMVFVDKNTDNINYFDASFANTCLELESIFVEVALGDDDESLDFF